MTAPMSRDIALRIGLAARALSAVDESITARTLAQGLADKLDLPITESKLGGLTVADLRSQLGIGETHADALKAAVRCLWGEGVDLDGVPRAEPYEAGDLPGSIRVAVASNTEQNLDGHFGSCERFLVYQVSPTAMRLVAVRATAEADEAEDRNVARSALINDCQVVYVQSIGGPAAAKVVRAGVHPVKVPKSGVATETLQQLQAILTAPPPWLAKIMGVASASLARFADALEAEDAA